MTDREGELHTLCRTCGICCSGVMFAYVEVDADQPGPETRRRLNVLEAEKRFTLPCPAHSSDTGCTVYEDRPRICASYTCSLYQEHEATGGELGPRLVAVRRIRELVRRVREREAGRDPSWLPKAIAEMLADKAMTNVDPELLLDVAELAMRLQRDLGWSPAAVDTQREP